MQSTRENIVEVRRSTNLPPHRQIISKVNQFYDASQAIKWKSRKQLLDEARNLGGASC